MRPAPTLRPTDTVGLPPHGTELPYAATGAKLGWAVLAYVIGVTLVITLEPFTFEPPAHPAVMWWDAGGVWGGWFDVGMNVVLFLPLGFLGALAHAAPTGGNAIDARRAGLGRAFALGALLSAAIEVTQLFEPGRYPSPTDVLSNATGAWAGAYLHARSARHLGATSPLLGRLALELPVMGLVYVALPLLTLAGLTAGGGELRGLGVTALGGFGGVLLGTVQRRHFGPRGVLRPGAAAAAAGLWFGAGTLPAVATAPRAYAVGVAFAVAGAWLVGRPAVPGVRAIERRFEGEALGRAAPWLAAYLLLAPLGDTGPASLSKLGILRDLEGVAGLTVLGYVLAEAWGRREWRYRHAVARVGAVALAVAAVLAGLRAGAGGTLGAPWATAAGVAVHALGACYGGWIYHLQRAHVRALVAARGAAAPTRGAARTSGVRAA
jgi:glycopeptide antibiotics resistance protein